LKKLATFLFIAFAAALLFGGMYTLRWMHTPLDPPLELDLSQHAQPASAAQPLAANPQQGNQKTCGNSGAMALLVSGVSMPVYRPVHGVGAVRLVKVDFDNRAVSILDVPRALFVQAEHLDLADKTALTVVYRIARDAATGNNPQVINRKATQDMAQVLVDDFDYVPDHYVTVDPSKFVDLVDTLGGIDINLSQPVDGTDDDLGYFSAGQQHITGQRALDLLRILHPVGVANPSVWQKFERQRVVTLGILSAMLAPSNWDKLPDVAKDARQMVVTDLSASQVLNLLCMVKEAGESADFQSVSPDIAQQISDEEVRITDEQAVKELIQSYGSDKK
jgi:LCP family protein required for cell wall assembly